MSTEGQRQEGEQVSQVRMGLALHDCVDGHLGMTKAVKGPV